MSDSSHTTTPPSSVSTPPGPHWSQPSHPNIQKVIHTSSEKGFGTKSYSTISVPPHGLYTTLHFSPCTLLKEGEASYATVQVGDNQHVDLGCDFLYTEHSCDPSLVRPHLSRPLLYHGPIHIHSQIDYLPPSRTSIQLTPWTRLIQE